MNTVNCYFCEKEVADSEAQNADPYNNDDGGSICSNCLETKEDERAEIYLNKKESIASLIFDFEGDDYERPSELHCHELAEIILNHLE